MGLDILFGRGGADRFAIASGVTADRDFIQDYEDGVDLLDLTGNLTFDSLTLRQNEVRTLLVETDTNQVLAVLNNTDVVDLDAHDFIQGIAIRKDSRYLNPYS